MYDATDILNCKVEYIDRIEMQKLCNTFFKMIYDYDPSYIGNMVPDDNLYYLNAQ